MKVGEVEELGTLKQNLTVKEQNMDNGLKNSCKALNGITCFSNITYFFVS